MLLLLRDPDTQEPLDVVEMFDAWNGRPCNALRSLSPVLLLTIYMARGHAVEPHPCRWVQCPHMLARRAGTELSERSWKTALEPLIRRPGTPRVLGVLGILGRLCCGSFAKWPADCLWRRAG